MLKSTQIESEPAAQVSAGSTPDAITALNRRAPSTCTTQPKPVRGGAHRLLLVERPHPVPPARLWVCSNDTTLVAGNCSDPPGENASSTCSAVNPRPLLTGQLVDQQAGVQRRRAGRLEADDVAGPFGQVTRRRGAGVRGQSDVPLHSVPVGRNSAASRPRISATRSCSRFVVGSWPRCSSPTSASAIARRIPSVGRVCVSE